MAAIDCVKELKNFEGASHAIGIPHHILHLWTKKFPTLQPKKISGSEMGFEPRDIAFAKGLKCLLVDEKRSILSVQKILNERGMSYISAYGKDNERKKQLNGDYIGNNNDKKVNSFADLKHLLSSTDDKLTIKQPKIIVEDTNIIDNKQKANKNTDKAFDSFESDWRNFMHDKGKAVTPQEVRAKRPLDDIETDDLMFIDDDFVNLKVELPVTNVIEDTKIASLSKVLSVENKEKMLHILSKLDILKSELLITKDVIHKTIKAFGYSGFDNAYERHDNKSAY